MTTSNAVPSAWAPDRICLQREQGEGGSPTWREDSVGDGDLIEEVEYVRAALATTPSAQEEAVRVTEGYELAPLEPTPSILDVRVSYALNVWISSRYNWSACMRDVGVRMIATSGDKPLQVSGYVTLDEAFMSAAAPCCDC